MTATSDFMDTGQTDAVACNSVNRSEVLLRLLQRLAAVALVAAVASLWIAPGADLSADVVVMKTGLSILACVMAAMVALSSIKPAQPEIEIDTSRRELRVVRPAAPNFLQLSSTGQTELLCRWRFSELGRVERVGRTLGFWDHQGQFLADVHVTEQEALDKLVSGLRDAGQQV